MFGNNTLNMETQDQIQHKFYTFKLINNIKFIENVKK